MAKEEKQDLNEELKNKTEEVEESTDTEVEELIEVDELTETKVALDEMEDRYLRLQAELANIRKRNQKSVKMLQNIVHKT